MIAEGSKFAAAWINLVLGGWDRLIGRSRCAVTETSDMDAMDPVIFPGCEVHLSRDDMVYNGQIRVRSKREAERRTEVESCLETVHSCMYDAGI